MSRNEELPGAALATHVEPDLYATPDIAGTGGTIKSRPEDFVVEEVPLYEPVGEGEHLYLFIEKRNLSTFELVRIIARHFGVDHGAVGYAGLKDRFAVTRQVVSVHLPDRPGTEFPSIRHDRIVVLWAARHTNKLRVGHLRANRFTIVLRDVDAGAILRASRVLRVLGERGVPNRFGEQRFGFHRNNHLIARALIREDYEGAARELLSRHSDIPTTHDEARDRFSRGDFAGAIDGFPVSARTERIILHALRRGESWDRAWHRVDAQAVGFFLSAFQSAVFNAVLARRLAEGSADRLEAGDVAFKHDNRALFAVDDAVASDPTTGERLRAFEISPSGPLWGPEMLRAGARIGAMELAALESTGVGPEAVGALSAKLGGPIGGSRRPLRVPVLNPAAEGGADEHGAFIRCAFELPRGSFATVVLREIMKPSRVLAEDDEGDRPGS